jgi:protein phosphatase
VSKSKVILFGGATGDTGRYVITGDTYALDIIGNKWSKLDGKIFHLISSFAHVGSGIAPSPRAAHGSCSVDSLQMVVYGGATGGGSLASDDLYLLDLRNGDSAT